jgi:uncharacterized membrane protein YccC
VHWPRELRSAVGRARGWLGPRDPGYGALRRALRTAILMPAAFAFTLKVLDSPVMAPFAAFGAISTLLLVDFRGEMRDRVRSQAALVIVGGALTCLGTLCASSDVAAVAAMTVLGVVIIFSAVVSSVLAGATTSLLLSFILPVSLPGPVSQIPDRLAGWGISGGVSVIAIALLWPAPASDPLGRAAATCCRALAACLRTSHQLPEAVAQAARSALAALRRTFLATPYRPTGLTTAARAQIRLVDELTWLGRIVLPGDPEWSGGDAGATEASAPPIHAVRTAAATALEQGADVLDRPHGPVDGLTRAGHALAAVTGALADRVVLPRTDESPAGDAEVAALVSSLDPAFRAQEMSFMASQIAANVTTVAAAIARPWVARVLGRQPPGIVGPWTSIRERAGAHLAPSSVALHNALRGGVALGIGVLAARLIGVEHAFWVSFGTLSILRSSALSTGQTFARALAGTVLGFLVGAALVLAIGTDSTVLWILLPFAILLGGVAPAAISFLAGQAGFTVVLFILFNILAPAGWRIGLVRIEDVALGGGTSLVIGLLFWPRGAGAALRRAVADAFAESASYLSSAVGAAVACCAPGMPLEDAPPPPEAARAAAASRRLDDTFRTYLTEGGPKRMGLPAVAAFVNGPLELRLAADAILELWRDEQDPTQSRVAAARELNARAREVRRWYAELESALTNDRPLPDPQPADPLADERLVRTVDHDLRSPDGSATAAAVRVVWTGDHLDAARRLEAVLVEPARQAGFPGTLSSPPPTPALARLWPRLPRRPRPAAPA